jgi:hypothetical protein
MDNLVDNQGRIIYDSIIAKYSWIVAEKQRCILSPDSDGLLCGLLMSAFFGWEIVGYYDGKVMILKEKESIEECVFLDMEIFRNYVKSLGQHMLLWNKKDIPPNWVIFVIAYRPTTLENMTAKVIFVANIHLALFIYC